MRHPRLRGEGLCYQHVISRIIEKRFLLGTEEKEHFTRLMRSLSGFAGLKIVTHSLMSSHFHILIEQPDKETLPALSKEELFRRLEFIYDSFAIRDIKAEFARAEAAEDEASQQRILDRYARRMGDVSNFMQELKQRFSQWYNRRNNRKGPLWDDRFKSVLVEADPHALMTMAAYIDLNPVRAGIVERPEDYRWCGYAEAVAGNRQSRAGLGRILDQSPRVSGENFEQNWEETSRIYRLWLYHEGEAIAADPETGDRGRKGFSAEEIKAEEGREGQLNIARQIRCRVRYLTDGAVFGSAAFVNRIFDTNRSCFGVKRTTGARKIKGANWGGLCVIRDLRKV